MPQLRHALCAITRADTKQGYADTKQGYADMSGKGGRGSDRTSPDNSVGTLSRGGGGGPRDAAYESFGSEEYVYDDDGDDDAGVVRACLCETLKIRKLHLLDLTADEVSVDFRLKKKKNTLQLAVRSVKLVDR